MINCFDGVKGRWKVSDLTALPILPCSVCSHTIATNTQGNLRTGNAGTRAELIVQSSGNRSITKRFHLLQRRSALLNAVQLRQVYFSLCPRKRTLHNHVPHASERLLVHGEARQLRHVCALRTSVSPTRHGQHEVVAERVRAEQHRRQRVAICTSPTPRQSTGQLQLRDVVEQTVREGQTAPRLVCNSCNPIALTPQHQRARRLVRRVDLAHVRQQWRVYPSHPLDARTVQHEPPVDQPRPVHVQRRQLRQVYAHTPSPRPLRNVRFTHLGSAPSRIASRSSPGRSVPHALLAHSPASSSSVSFSPTCSSNTSSASFGTSTHHITLLYQLSTVSVFNADMDAPPTVTDCSSLKPMLDTYSHPYFGRSLR